MIGVCGCVCVCVFELYKCSAALWWKIIISLRFYFLNCGSVGLLNQACVSAQKVSAERGPHEQASVLLNGPIMASIRRNVFMEPCY